MRCSLVEKSFRVTALAVLALGSDMEEAAAQTRLNNLPVSGGDVAGFTLSPDGSRVVFLGDLDTNDAFETYSASTSAAGTQVTLSSTAVAGGDVGSIPDFNPEGSRVVYRGDLSTDEVFELYSSSATTPGTQIKISNTPAAGADVGFNIKVLATRGLYNGDLVTPGTVELFSASQLSAGTQIKLNNTPPAGGGLGSSPSILPASGGTRVVYDGIFTTAGVSEIYSASTTTGGTQITLNDPPVSGGNVTLASPSLSSDGSRVLYRGDLAVDTVQELYSASVSAPGTQVKLNNTPVTGGDIDDHKAVPGLSRVVYLGDLTTDEVTEIYSASTTAAGTQIRLNNTPVAGGEVSFVFGTTPDGARILYFGDLLTNDVTEIYSASPSQEGTQITLNDPPVPGGTIDEISGFKISADGSRVVWLGTLTNASVFQYYSASPTAAGTQVQLTDFPQGVINGSVYRLTPDSRFLIFLAGELGNISDQSLWAVDLLGASAPVRLTPDRDHDVSISGQFQVTADSRRVVVRADFDEQNVFNLYAFDLPGIDQPPTLTINGKKTIKTSARRVKIAGTAESEAGIARVEFKIPGAKFTAAKGTAQWKVIVRPSKKRTPVRIRALDNEGQRSVTGKVTIKQSPRNGSDLR